QEQAITPQEALKKGYGDDYGRSQLVSEGQESDTATRSLSGPMQSHQEGIHQCTSVQSVSNPSRPVEKLNEILPYCEKVAGPSKYLQFTQ
ncbi:hypothetical protein O181_129559, partial [Austropuccinia psidii MF-1]|nr:hypothetical protein [Austropuccinia psidii MF-1]